MSDFDPKHADRTIANDLNRMTAGEREIVYDDIHGVRNLRMEETTPLKLLECLSLMNDAIKRIDNKSAYDEACKLKSRYVLRNNQFRIIFLRAEEYDIDKAAQRFVNYLDVFYNFFGTKALMRPIYYNDLEKNDQTHVREGVHQLLPCRDRTGRRIMTRIGNMGSPDQSQSTPSMLRACIYLLQVLSSDEQTQKYGCVMVFYGGLATGETSFLKETNLKGKMNNLFAAFPIRISAIHICFPDTPVYQIGAAALMLFSPSFMRVRVRKHMGSLTECKYSLIAYGIPGDHLPLTSSGRIKTTNHLRWLATQKEREECIQMGLPPFQGVDCPLVMDVLIGNAGPSFGNNPGNTKYREIIELYYMQYDNAADTQGKTRISWQVLEHLTKLGGRILVRDRRGWWTVANVDRAREKIGHDFREIRRQLAAVKKRSQNHSSTMTFARLDGKRSKTSKGGIVDGGGEGDECRMCQCFVP